MNQRLFEIIFHAFRCFRNYFPDIILFKNCRNSDGTTCILRAICTIRKGEEINDNYGFSYQIRPKEERQETLSQHYFFTCDCPACKQQWPLFHGKIQGRATTFVCSGCQRPLTPKEVEKLKKCPKCKKELKLAMQGSAVVTNYCEMELECLYCDRWWILWLHQPNPSGEPPPDSQGHILSIWSYDFIFLPYKRYPH